MQHTIYIMLLTAIFNWTPLLSYANSPCRRHVMVRPWLLHGPSKLQVAGLAWSLPCWPYISPLNPLPAIYYFSWDIYFYSLDQHAFFSWSPVDNTFLPGHLGSSSTHQTQWPSSEICLRRGRWISFLIFLSSTLSKTFYVNSTRS